MNSISTPGLYTLGAIAGLTIFIGLPAGRLRGAATSGRAFLNALAIGILLFLVVDIFEHGSEPVGGAITAAKEGSGSWEHAAQLALVFGVPLALGLVGLYYYDVWVGRRARATTPKPGPGAMAVGELARTSWLQSLSPARRLSLLIAVGIGAHNFAEGLAIGQSAASGAISLATLLVIGFGLHNATEGFGIVGPLAAAGDRAGWGWLAAMGLIGGGPTFLGTVIGNSYVNETLAVGFLSLAGGSIIYVVIQLLGVAGKLGRRDLLFWGLLAGLLAGFATDFVISAAGV